jgi:hypothetical protein
MPLIPARSTSGILWPTPPEDAMRIPRFVFVPFLPCLCISPAADADQWFLSQKQLIFVTIP